MKSEILLQLETSPKPLREEMRMICPRCQRRKLYLNTRTGMYLCFRASCGIRGRVSTGSQSKSTQRRSESPEKRWEDLGGGWHRVPGDFSYTALTDGESTALQVRDFEGRHRGWVIRQETYGSGPKAVNRIDPEYPGLHFPRLATQCTDLVLVEDIPSAERLSEYLPTAALLGARLTHDQAEYLASNGVKSLVFCLDDDATHRGVQQAREHGLYFRTSSVHCSPDPKDMTAQELNDLVQRIRFNG